VATGARCETPEAGHVEHTDLSYVAEPDAGAAHRLDVYVPKAAGRYPALLWIHGGAWSGGDKLAPPVRYLADRGYVVASTRYRFSSEAPFPAQIQDVKAAVRFLRARAQTYKIDPTRIAVAGESAGGHLASLLATSKGVAALEGAALGHAAESSAVAAAAPFYGPSDFTLMNAQAEAAGCVDAMDHDAEGSPESRLVGCTVAADSCEESVQAANPIRYVDANDPPFLIQHGARDCTVPPDQSRVLHAALEAAKVESQLVIEPQRDHGGAPFERAALDRFLDRTLRGCEY
jgi:acetyl esterase/lipase